MYHSVGWQGQVVVQSVLEKKKSKGILKLGQNRSGGVVVSQKQGYISV